MYTKYLMNDDYLSMYGKGQTERPTQIQQQRDKERKMYL